jgi:hypothetical protein
MADHLDMNRPLTTVTFLGVRVAERSTSGGVIKSTVTSLARTLTSFTGTNTVNMTEAERIEYTEKARVIRQTLTNSALSFKDPISHATAADVAWLIRKPLYTSSTCPELDTLNVTYTGDDFDEITRGEIENTPQYLKIRQRNLDLGFTEEFYTAFVCLTRFPDTLFYPEADGWGAVIKNAAPNAEWSIRFTVNPVTRVAKEVNKGIRTIVEERNEQYETGQRVDYTVEEQYAKATSLEHTITKNRNPWVYASYRIQIRALTPEKLDEQAKIVIDGLRSLGISATVPSHDQLGLLLESMPGGGRKDVYERKQSIDMIGGGALLTSATVGDRVTPNGQGWLGSYVGKTTVGDDTPVFFSPHVAMAQNSPPGVAILGQPGSGKSFLAFTLAYQAALTGVWTIYIDPKADAKPMGELSGLGAAKVFDLRDGYDGMLDPFVLGEDINQSKLLALETLRLLLGATHLSEDRENAIMRALDWTVSQPNPSLWLVVEWLLMQPDTHAKNLGAVLKTLRDLPFARLCFAPAGGYKLNPQDGLTIVTLLGLDLPNASSRPEDYSYENRLAVSVMYLLTRYARALMLSMNKNHPKAIFIDEAWAITGTPQGAKLIPETARMGRSHNTALVLITQNAMDLMDEQITNSISTVFAFRSRDQQEIKSVLRLMGVTDNDGTEQDVRDLRNGECLMRDVSGRVSRVQIDPWATELFNAFNTNPETRGGATKEEGA